MKLSIIVPCYNEEEVLPLFYAEICRTAEELPEVTWEFDFVDDGSKDGTVTLLREYAKTDSRVRFTSFSRNFGKEAGMLAGLRMATGDYVATMDADLQHPPKLLLEMYQKLQSGECDCVTARRTDRKGDKKISTFFARMFYKLMNRLSDTHFVDGAGDYRMMRRAMSDAVLSMSEYNRFSKGIFEWVGFQNQLLPYENVSRAAGETKWSFWKLLKYSLNGITAFSTAPLMLSSILGVVSCCVAFLTMLVVVVKTLLWGDPVAGFPTLIAVMLLVGGLLMLFIGILGQYMAKTYMETKHRPLYIVRETEKGRE